jgi:glycine/D-amino acid oxidase-like deaminating enzyme
MLSFWEIKNWFSGVDFTIVGSGIVGISTAIELREKYPKSKILILEKGYLPQGASTKNAGFACFGSLSEMIEDLKNHTEQEFLDLVSDRWNGLQLLRQRIGDETLNLQQHGGYEVFLKHDKAIFSECEEKLTYVNNLLKPLFKTNVFQILPDTFAFKNTLPNLLFNALEAQIDTGNMMQALLKQAHENNILIINNQHLLNHTETNTGIEIHLNEVSFNTRKLIFTTNGFASNLVNKEVLPARAQVLITKPIKNLALQGTFHIDKGYYYFRNFEDRILLGGGRNLDFEGETTTEINITEKIQQKLEQLLKEVILPHQPFEIAHRWSGIMGVGNTKAPIIKQLSNHSYCGVRMGGMGVAIGSLVGKRLAQLITLE